MGKDVERMISNVNNLITVCNSEINSLAGAVIPAKKVLPVSPIKSGGQFLGTNYPMVEISTAMDKVREDYSKMKSLNKSLYVSSNDFNNQIGSPWTELIQLNEACEMAENYASAHATLTDPGEKMGMLALMNIVLSNAVDFKYAVTIYHDYLQRGYDNNYNGKQPSITFKMGKNKITTSNLKQRYSDNVNVPTPSIDPF